MTTAKENSEGYPVLVYANSVADDPKEPWDGSSVAAIGNIMVIAFRYRVGVLGFVQPGFTDDTRNNFGLWDMIAALQWIKVRPLSHELSYGMCPGILLSLLKNELAVVCNEY